MNKVIISSLALAAASSFAASSFYINQVGYDTGKPISIIVKSDEELQGSTYTLSPDGGTGTSTVTGTIGAGANPDKWLSNGKFYTIELGTAALAPGKYKLTLANGSSSQTFTVGDNLLAQQTLGAVLDYFYNDRATNPQIVNWDQKVSVYNGGGKTRDVHGGWYDASGDVSKYLSHLSYANYLNPQQIPLTVWALAFTAERIPALLSSTTTKAKTTDEAAYGADFLVRMLDEQGFFYMTVFDNWGMGSRYLCAFSGSDGEKSSNYQTAFREGGGMAIAGLARVSKLGVTGDYTSAEYLDAAEHAFAHLSEKQSIGGNCAYCDDGKENIIDDYTALLAATELYAATEKVDYLKDARARAKNLINRLSDDGYFWSDDAKTRPFWHASDAGLPLVALVRYAEIESKTSANDGLSDGDLTVWGCTDCIGCGCHNMLLEDAINTIKKHYQWLVDITNKVENPFGYARQTFLTSDTLKSGFFIPHDNESNYWWQGEDARIASLAAASIYTIHALGKNSDESADKYATDQLDWILGKNPYNTCMMYGFGTKVPEKYDGQSNYDATLKGGIANGITGRNKDGSGIAWDDDGVAYVGFPSDEPWNNWRWIEQWLPHSTWYLMALATRYDEAIVNIQPVASIAPKSLVQNQFGIQLNGKTLLVNASGKSIVHVIDLHGKQVSSTPLTGGKATLDLSRINSGVYLVQVPGLGAKKIMVK